MFAMLIRDAFHETDDAGIYLKYRTDGGIIIIIIIIHEFHRDASLETKLQGCYVSHITLQL